MDASLAYGYHVKYKELFNASVVHKELQSCANTLDLIHRRSTNGTLKISTFETNISHLPAEIFAVIKEHLYADAVLKQRNRKQCEFCLSMNCDSNCGGCGGCCECTEGDSYFENDLTAADGFLEAHGLIRTLRDDRFSDTPRPELSLFVGVSTNAIPLGKPDKGQKKRSNTKHRVPAYPAVTIHNKPTINAFVPDYFASITQKHEKHLTELARRYQFTFAEGTEPKQVFVADNSEENRKLAQTALKPADDYLKPSWIFASDTYEYY